MCLGQDSRTTCRHGFRNGSLGLSVSPVARGLFRICGSRCPSRSLWRIEAFDSLEAWMCGPEAHALAPHSNFSTDSPLRYLYILGMCLMRTCRTRDPAARNPPKPQQPCIQELLP